jgi:hypothetical protein
MYNGFTKDYTVWIYHGHAHRMREEVVRPRLKACDDDARVVDMLEDAHQALFNDTRDREVMEEEAKLFYKMMDSAKIPLHDNTTVSQLDAHNGPISFHVSGERPKPISPSLVSCVMFHVAVN